ncbi:MAG: MazG family protein [Dehalococcoidia bacterium]|nr:MazG family protein [Dehalococcoidia bacterium]
MGDVLLQVLMHTAVGEREGTFGLGDVTEAIGKKLIRRNPHVFGDAEATTASEVWQSWEALKQAERPRGSILDGVPVALPALAASQSMQGRARRIGFDWPDVEGPLEKLVEEVREFADAEAPGHREEEFGDILFVLAHIGQRLGIDSEHALRAANAKFRERFGIMERLAVERGITMKGLPLEELDALWDEAKAQIAAEGSRL